MEETILEIWNHITVINEELSSLEPIKIDVAILKMQMSSIIYWGRFLGGVVAAILITQLFQIWQIKKNGKK